ncbi:hypothetical protein TSAR_005694 [Trichomalopsis sarcophagae]|uniref:Uncharacterized protein n=1 Tax=Trichomalopsis sarcophagae TaxID=543379 RepID=A0A232FIP2_9HYME|nr:hypothetical protein TSAR_005694 [Trichomalopsis sarcophagae]
MKITADLEKGTEQWCVSLSSDERKITLESLELRQDGRREYVPADFVPSHSMSAGKARNKREGLRVAFIEHTSEEASGRSMCSVLEAYDDAGEARLIVQLRRAMKANYSVETQIDLSTPQSLVETEVDKWVLKLLREEINCVLEMLILKTSDDQRSNIRRLKLWMRIDSVWGRDDSNYPMVNEKKRPSENAVITSTTTETSLTLNSEITLDEELSSDTESQRTLFVMQQVA